MFEAFISGAADVFSPVNMLVMLIGSIIGILIGVTPVISGLTGMAVLLPFVYSWPPEVGLILLLSIAISGVTGGSITAIVLNIPGTPTNAATLIDGYPMTRKGQGGRAIGAALGASGAGGVLSVLLALAVIPVIMSLLMAFRSPEMFLLVLLGISFMAALGSGTMVKGFIAGFLGIVISFVGFQAVTGAARFTFGTTYLYDGFPLVPFIVGLFGLPELVDLMIQRGTIAQGLAPAKIGKDIFEGVKDVFRHYWLFIRSTVIGYIVGVIPGIGSSVAIFASYAQAKQFSKHPEKFGTGCVEGVIAPECANNAVFGGALLPTLAFGIPGSATMAIILAGLTLMGIIPGPGLLKNNLDLAFYLLVGVAVINIVAAVLCFFLTRWLIKIAYIHADYLIPPVLILTAIGAYAMRLDMMDVVMLLPFAILGYAMKKFDYPRPALVLGFILGALAEKYLFLSIDAFGPIFFLSPLSISLLIIMVLVLSIDPLRKLVKRLKHAWE